MHAGAKRSLGQNFLVDKNIVRKIVAALELEPADSVLEIGPGNGALTNFLAKEAGRVLALEKDSSLAFGLDKDPKVQVVNMDILDLDFSRLDRLPGIKIAGNLPYNIAQTMLWDLVAQAKNFGKAIFMIQKEVAQRISAPPGNKEYGGLSVWIQSFTTVKRLFQVPPTVFKPRPKIDSSVISLAPLPEHQKEFDSLKLAGLIRTMFQNRRKQIGKILKNYWNDRTKSVLQACDLDPMMRPEELVPRDFQRLSQYLGP